MNEKSDNPKNILDRMETPRLILRLLTWNDMNAIFEYASDPEVTRYMIWPTHQSLNDTRQFIQGVFEKYQNGIYDEWVLESKSDNHLIGIGGAGPIKELEGRVFEIGYVLRRQDWGHGYATEAVHHLLGHCFQEYPVESIIAHHHHENLASGRVMQKCGMVKEASFEKYLPLKNEVFPLFRYRITRAQWMDFTL